MKQSDINITCLSNTLEWYDFGLFIFMAPIIGQHFFPQQAPHLATQEALLVFAVGFICRPLGGIFFGHYGDTLGRVKVLRSSTFLITLSTLLIGLLPSYHTIGIAATMVFIALRLAQGFSIGGEYSGALIYLTESATPKRRGFTTSFAAVGANIGFLFATLSVIVLKTICSDQALHEWGWRLPFILTGIPGAIFLYYRFKLVETKVYLQLQNRQQVERKPLFTALKYAPRQLLKIVGLTCMGASFYYVFFGYMPNYLEQYIGIPLKQGLIIQCFLFILMLLLVPLAGLCGDYFSRKKMIIFTALFVILLSLPCFYLLQLHSPFTLILSLSIATVLSSFEQGNVITAIVENCPVNVRYSGLAFSYNLGNALFGGTAPLITAILVEKQGPLMPAFYLMIMAALSLITATTLLSHNRAEANIGTELKELSSIASEAEAVE